MAGNHLKLNDNNTEVITFTAPNVEMNMLVDVIHIGDYIIPPVKCVRDLGVGFDHHMKMHENITKTCASCRFHLQNISLIRDLLIFVNLFDPHVHYRNIDMIIKKKTGSGDPC